MVGDSLAQKTEKAMQIESHGKEGYNYPRTMRMGLWGLLGAGPLCHPWYKWLHVAATNLKIGKWRTIGFKMGFDLLLFMPFIINVYFVMVGAMEGRSIDQIKVKIKDNVLPSWMTALSFWTGAQLLNFRFMPIQYQSVTVFFFNAIWNSLISIINHQEQYGKKDDVRGLEAELSRRQRDHDEQLSSLHSEINSLKTQLRLMQAKETAAVTFPMSVKPGLELLNIAACDTDPLERVCVVQTSQESASETGKRYRSA
jgi:protein Mpv17